MCPLIHSKNWDTRVAAAAAVGAIAENVNHRSLKEVIACAQKHLSNLGYDIDLNEILATKFINNCISSKALSFRR